MRNRILSFFYSIFMVLMLIHPVLAASTCIYDGTEMPCEAFWPKYGWIGAIPFTLIGLLVLMRPEWIQRWYKMWWGRAMSTGFYRGLGIILFITGLYFLYRTIFP